MAVAPQERVLEAFVEATDTLVEDFDLIDVLHRLCARCVEFLDMTAVGIMLADPHGHLHVLAASDERAGLLDLFTAQNDAGPCAKCLRTGGTQLDVDLTDAATTSAFPAFAAQARHAGYRTAHALPLRLRQRTIGVLGLFHEAHQTMSPADVRLGQTLADVATIAILQQRTVEHVNVERAQLQAALTSRIVIEQAKGILAERWQTGVDDAFDALRGYARSHRARIADLAREVIDGTIDTDVMRTKA